MYHEKGPPLFKEKEPILKVNSRHLMTIAALLTAVSALYYYSFYEQELPPQELVKNQLSVSALSTQSVWNQRFLSKNWVIKGKIGRLENGSLCHSLKGLDTRKLTHKEISNQLNKLGYRCIVRPMAVNLKASPLKYLKVDNTITDNPHEIGVAHQEICQDQAQSECVIRIKRDGFPLNRRSNPHSTKAVLLDANGDPGSYDNEAFKISVDGQAIPKGPSQKFGLRKCPYKRHKELCESWVDALMDEVHPALKEPMGSRGLGLLYGY
jgi:hypothetical protein